MYRRPLKVLLDANIWRLVADDPTAPGRLEVASRKLNLRVVVAPSVVYEAGRTTNAGLRQRLVDVMTRPHWTVVMPEAFDECEELLGELRRLHPEWCRKGDTDWRERNRRDWLPGKTTFWARLRRDPAMMAGVIGSFEGDTIELARERARDWRKQAMAADWKFEHVDPSAVRCRPIPVPGWRGDEIEAWRWPSLDWATKAVSDSPYKDWLDPFFSLSTVPSADWVRFWFYEVEASRMPRWWVRSACEILQAVRTVTSGTPCDAQLSTYLVACDLSVSDDRAFVEILERCRTVAPVSMGTSVALGKQGIEEVFKVLERASRR